MIMRLVKTVALMWLAKKVKEKAFDHNRRRQSRPPVRRTSRS
jgi:hypothetical protein